MQFGRRNEARADAERLQHFDLRCDRTQRLLMFADEQTAVVVQIAFGTRERRKVAESSDGVTVQTCKAAVLRRTAGGHIAARKRRPHGTSAGRYDGRMTSGPSGSSSIFGNSKSSDGCASGKISPTEM